MPCLISPPDARYMCNFAGTYMHAPVTAETAASNAELTVDKILQLCCRKFLHSTFSCYHQTQGILNIWYSTFKHHMRSRIAPS